MKLYVLRHGRTVWNQEGKLQGRVDIPLCEEGRQSARETAKTLQDVVFSAAFSSPLSRARETAELILEGSGVQVIPDERLIEIAFGAAEGMRLADLDNSEFVRNLFGAPEQYCPPEGGESYAALERRCREFVQEVLLPHEKEWDNVLLVAHGGSVRGLFSALLGKKSDEIYGSHVQKNCAVNVIDCTDGCFSVEIFAGEFCESV